MFVSVLWHRLYFRGRQCFHDAHSKNANHLLSIAPGKPVNMTQCVLTDVVVLKHEKCNLFHSGH